MDAEFVTLRIIHIVSGAFWVARRCSWSFSFSLGWEVSALHPRSGAGRNRGPMEHRHWLRRRGHYCCWSYAGAQTPLGTPRYVRHHGLGMGYHHRLRVNDPQCGPRCPVRFDVEGITNINARDIKVTNEGGGFLVSAVYDHNAPFIGNVSFTVHFDKKALIRR